MAGSSDKKPPLRDLELRYPPMPQTLIEAMELMEHPEELEVRPVTRMVQRDPFVVARLLHTVNSAYYGLRSAVKSAERAVVMLGPVAVAGIVVGMNMLKLRSVFGGPAGDSFLRLIKHSIATAFLARHILDGTPDPSDRRAPERIGVSFTAGLLHDFGKMVLVYNHPEKAARFYEERILKSHLIDSDARRLEQFLFGFDHSEAGEYLARKLSFPDELSSTIRFHHEPEEFKGASGTKDVIRAVAAANHAAKTMGFGFDSELTWEECLDRPAWDAPLFAEKYANLQSLKEDLTAQQEHLEAYVRNLTSSAEEFGLEDKA